MLERDERAHRRERRRQGDEEAATRRDDALVAQARVDLVRGHRRRGVAELVEAHAVRGHAGAQAQLRQRPVGGGGAGHARLELRAAS